MKCTFCEGELTLDEAPGGVESGVQHFYDCAVCGASFKWITPRSENRRKPNERGRLVVVTGPLRRGPGIDYEDHDDEAWPDGMPPWELDLAKRRFLHGTPNPK